MPLWTQGKGQVLGRRDSNRGVLYSYVRNGVEITAKWPRKRGTNLHPKTLEQMEKFTMVQWAYKFSDAIVQRSFADAVAGTPLMPRDLFLMVQSGRAYMVIQPDGSKWFHMATIKSVSDSLDAIAQLEGSMLIRGPEVWEGTGQITAPGQVLVSQISGPPQWEDLGGGAGLQQIAQIILAAPAATIDFLAIPSAFSELQLAMAGAGTGAAGVVGVDVRLNGDAGANYDYSQWNRFASAGAVGQTSMYIGGIPDAAVAPRSGACRISLPNYSQGTFWKIMSTMNTNSDGGAQGNQYSQVMSGEWHNVAVVNRVTLIPRAGNFATGTRATLYGLV